MNARTMADPNGPANMLATGLFWTVGMVALYQVGRFGSWAYRKARARRDAYLQRHVTAALTAPVNLRDYRQAVNR